MTPKKSNGKNIIALHGHGCNGKEGLISSEKMRIWFTAMLWT